MGRAQASYQHRSRRVAPNTRPAPTVEVAPRPEHGPLPGNGAADRPQLEAETAGAVHDPLIRLDFSSRFEKEGLKVLWAFLQDDD